MSKLPVRSQPDLTTTKKKKTTLVFNELVLMSDSGATVKGRGVVLFLAWLAAANSGGNLVRWDVLNIEMDPLKFGCNQKSEKEDSGTVGKLTVAFSRQRSR